MVIASEGHPLLLFRDDLCLRRSQQGVYLAVLHLVPHLPALDCPQAGHASSTGRSSGCGLANIPGTTVAVLSTRVQQQKH